MPPIGSSARTIIKPGDKPLSFQRRTEYGCPFDCGLCPDHEQHSCLALIEINEHCNLTCPVCFAEILAGARQLHAAGDRRDACWTRWSRAKASPIWCRFRAASRRLHPDFFAILDAVRARPIRHVMINTNGLRIAREPEFVARLAENKRGLEVYLQFDSLERDALMNLRGADLRDVRQQALENLERHGVSTTLVVTVKRGVNDGEIGDDRPPRAGMAMRARRHLPAGAGRRPQREFRQG